VKLCNRLLDDKRVQFRIYSYHFGYLSEAEEKIYMHLKALPAGIFFESDYMRYSPEVDERVWRVLQETDVLILPYRDITSTADMPLLVMEGMASLCTIAMPPAGDLPTVYGPSRFFITGDNWVESMLEIMRSAPKLLGEERERLHARNVQLNNRSSTSARAFKQALLGELPPRNTTWPENVLTFRSTDGV